MDHAAHVHDAKGVSHVHGYKRRLLFSIILTIPILILSEMIQMWLGFSINMPYQGYILFILSAVLYLYGGAPFLRGSIAELRQKQPGMMTLIGTAITVAFVYSSSTLFFISGKDFFWELATLIDIMLLGHWIESKTILGASMAVEELAKMMPRKAHRISPSGAIRDVDVTKLDPGDLVLVKPGEKIPSDGVVTEGESFLDESLLTGESKPVHKIKGDKVIGGSINAQGSLKVRIEKTGSETYLAQVMKVVREAQQGKTRTQRLADRAAALLFYVAISAAAVTYAAWYSAGQPEQALERAVTVLVIACPHALGLAIPLVVSVSTAISARNGILIRDRKAFEEARDIDLVVFDKTGTLTEGSFQVTEVVSMIDRNDMLRSAASVERNSEHIIAKAIVEYVAKEGSGIPENTGFASMPGKGAHANVWGKEVYVGGPSMLVDLGFSHDGLDPKKPSDGGVTVIYVVFDKKLAGMIWLSDRVKDESGEAVAELKKRGIEVYMITGDSEDVAASVSKQLKIDKYFSGVLPTDKAEKVKSLRQKGRKVAMVGDGVNDAPALASADIGIAIGAGTEVAIESADVILVRSDPRDVSKAIELSKRTYGKMVENLWWAAGYNIVAIPLAAGVLSGYGITLGPAVGAILMSLSTIIVAVNSQTLRDKKETIPRTHRAQVKKSLQEINKR